MSCPFCSNCCSPITNLQQKRDFSGFSQSFLSVSGEVCHGGGGSKSPLYLLPFKSSPSKQCTLASRNLPISLDKLFSLVFDFWLNLIKLD